MSITELVKAAKQQHPEDEISKVFKYGDTYIFFFQVPGAAMEDQPLDNFLTLDSNGAWTPLGIWNIDVQTNMVEVPESEWNVAEYMDLDYGGYLEHYGRKGMKWYEHIFGEEDSRAKYSSKEKSDPTFGEDLLGGPKLNKARRMSQEEIEHIDFTTINPDYKKGINWQENCVLCTTCMELRKRGYDVDAAPVKDGKGLTSAEMKSLFKDSEKNWQAFDAARMTPYGLRMPMADTNRKYFARYIHLQPTGARLNLCFFRSGAGGHSVYCEMEGKNKPVVYDCQSGEKWDTKELSKWIGISDGFFVLRMDNLEINDAEIDRAIGKKAKKTAKHDAFDGEEFDDILEHYGRLGMKWYQHKFGEEDGRAKYIDKVKNEEREKVEKKYKKPLETYDKKLSKDIAKIEKETDMSKIGDRYTKSGHDAATKYELDRMKKAELTRIAEMSWEDLLEENRKVNAMRREKVLDTIFSTTFFWWAGGMFWNLSGEDAKSARTKSRTGLSLNSVKKYGPNYNRRE